MKSFHAGDVVRLTGDFLRSTGQIAGGEGQRRWIVVTCPHVPPCHANAMLTMVNEPKYNPLDSWTAGEIKAEPCLLNRKINTNNLERCQP
jgi:ABC-type cobalamin transport system ATPase subunit